MTIQPCYLCPLRNGCAKREEFRKRIKGLHAVSVRFSCEILGAAIRRGRRIVIMHPYLVDSPDIEVHKAEVSATIASVASDYSFSAVVDRGEIERISDDGEEMAPIKSYGVLMSTDDVNCRRFRKRQKHTRIIRFLDEPDWTVCNSGNVQTPAGECDQRLFGCSCKMDFKCEAIPGGNRHGMD